MVSVSPAFSLYLPRCVFRLSMAVYRLFNRTPSSLFVCLPVFLDFPWSLRLCLFVAQCIFFCGRGRFDMDRL